MPFSFLRTNPFKKLLGSLLPRQESLSIQFRRQNPGWLTDHIAGRVFVPPLVPKGRLIEDRTMMTQQLGAMPLWSGYRSVEGYTRSTTDMRSSDEVRSDHVTGRFFAWLAAVRKPQVIAEFGSAFGVSGMYWLAGLDRHPSGQLLTFEPNEEWARIAHRNLAAVSSQFQGVTGTFEENIDATLGPDRRIDIAFIDAIHTSAFVDRQFAIVREFASPGALILFDDIDFSQDMQDCWARIASSPLAVSSAEIGRRVGIVELVAAA